MSSFLSNKYLKYCQAKGAPPTAVIDTDKLCWSCGYNVRGLNAGRNCPECGSPIIGEEISDDPLLAGDMDARRLTAVGLGLVTISLFAMGVVRVVVWVTSVATQNPDIYVPYHFGCAAVSLLWVIGVFLTLPASTNAADPLFRRLRRPVLISQMLWLAMWGCWFAAIGLGGMSGGNPLAPKVFGAAMLCSLIAAIGAWLYGWMLMRLAMGADLGDGGQRIHTALWMLPLPAVVLALVPDRIFAVALILVFPMVLLWGWFLVMWARGTWVMQRHVSWSLTMAAQNASRDERVRATRRELEEEINEKIRPTTPKVHQPEVRANPQAAPGLDRSGDVPLS